MEPSTLFIQKTFGPKIAFSFAHGKLGKCLKGLKKSTRFIFTMIGVGFSLLSIFCVLWQALRFVIYKPIVYLLDVKKMNGDDLVFCFAIFLAITLGVIICAAIAREMIRGGKKLPEISNLI